MKSQRTRRPRPSPAEVAAQYGPPIAPVTISRVPIFAPSERRTHAETTWVQETPWGSVAVTGRLNQCHRHLLDCAVATALMAAPTEDGGMRLVVDPYTLMRTRASQSWDYRWIEGLLGDLRRAEVRITEHGHPFPLVVTGIITAYGRYGRQRMLGAGRLSHRPDDRREMIALTISGAWWALWSDRPTAHYGQLLSAIAALSPIGQAVARLALTQRDGWSITQEKALQTIGANWPRGAGPAAKQQRKRIRRQLRRDGPTLAGMGIHIDAGIIHYARPATVYVSLPE